ncbi:MAG: AAA family ATPase [Gammaproteobacteria bacterium]|nr:AAA family ATPase [Gammaproteobacteria bacterium]
MTVSSDTSLQEQEVLLENLQNKELFSHPVEKFELLQTHISFVLLTGPFAYKFKKPVDLGFLDFSTLALRQHFCEEELRLNQRFSEELYLEVISITGSIHHPAINGTQDVIEYAVKMKQFPQSAQLDVVLSQKKLTPTHINMLADTIAEFHSKAEIASKTSEYGNNDSIIDPIRENFSHIRQLSQLAHFEPRLQTLESWCEEFFDKNKSRFEQRKNNGFIREGHGDMHLRNMALLDDKIILFDCLEFSPGLRWIDVINDLAFLLMDLDDRQETLLAWHCLNRYIERTGDYAGLGLLKFYKVYRALVRAKVDAIRLAQPHLTTDEQQQTCRDFVSYLELAEAYTHRDKPTLIITRGLSGSGKTTYTEELLGSIGAIRIRSDVERKRLFKDQNTLYKPEITEKVYQHLLRTTESLLNTGYSVIVDATFLDAQKIFPFHSLASNMVIPFHILEFSARPDTLHTRLQGRKADYSDANIQVLESQLKHWQEVPDELSSYLVQLDTEQVINFEDVRKKLI